MSARPALLALACILSCHAAPPADLASALEYLRDQKSYSWEVINSDPGPVEQKFETRRGTVTTVQQSMLPNLKGQIDRNGDMLIKRDWSDGVSLTSVIAADGTMLTDFPGEGWLTDREILTLQADERLRGGSPTPRYLLLRRADRPDIRRPDQELVPFLKSNATFTSAGDSYIVQLHSRNGDPANAEPDDSEPGMDVTITMNLRGGIIRDYEVKIDATRRATRARIAVPVSEQRVVVVTYLPVNKIDIPDEAREKLKAGKNAPGARPNPER